MRWLPLAASIVTVSIAAGAGQQQLYALAEDIKGVESDLTELDKIVDRLRENDLRTEGQLKLEVQKLNSNIASQSAKMDLILRLLQDGD